MPPIRSFPNVKPIKTERSHEENQERAYIAASRRSDRSLEARIESARRASEIHKRRTGRGLRVTEADVVNEEMYEEEDDDLPLKYRRLTAQLNSNGSDFNRRLAAFLQNQVAMRSALDQAMANNSASQQQWDPTSQSVQPNMLNWMPQQQQQPHGQQQSSSQFMPPIVSPGALHRSPAPANFSRQAPYPSPSSGSQTPSAGRPSLTRQQSDHHRRASDPAHTPQLFPTPRSNSDGGLDNIPENAVSPGKSVTPAPINTSQSPFSGPMSAPPHQMAFSSTGLTSSLPGDAQGFLNGPFDMAQFNGRQPDFTEKPNQYSYNSHAANSKQMFQGINQTLAPGAFESSAKPEPNDQSWMNNNFLDLTGTNFDLSNTPSRQQTPGLFDGQMTPADEFAAFIDSNAFDETPA